jgi:hypothetical protein
MSMACKSASDGKFQPGTGFSVTAFMDGSRRQRPVGRKGDMMHDDVVGIFQQVWLYGPASALSLGHAKECAIALLTADIGCRPSDLSKLFRQYEGWQQQIVFESWGMKVRFFYPKEVVPGSSRRSATNYYFSQWVEIKNTSPIEISTPQRIKAFLDASTGPDFADQHVSELDSTVQPFAWGRRKNGVLLPASVDHISNIVKGMLRMEGMTNTTTRSVRGASPSKVVQLFPDLLPEALKLGRWTDHMTFANHYQAPVNLVSTEPPPETIKSNVQQVLRWGFAPKPPSHVSAVDYMKGPDFWVGQTIPGFGKIHEFDEGIYKAGRGGKNELYHYELMDAISAARAS